MLILNKDQIAKCVSVLDVLNAVEKAILLQETKDYQMPDRMHIDHHDNVMLLMPVLAGDYFSIKFVSVFPGNTKKGLPFIHASVLLNDADTGEPLAMMEGSLITGLRTGALGGLGIAYTSPVDVKNIGLIGAGYQGFHQLLFAASVRNIENISLYDPFLKNGDEFIGRVKKHLPHVNISMKESAEEVIINSEVIVTATTSYSPVIPERSDIIEGKHFIGIGSFKPEMSEYPDQLFSYIENVIIDTDHALNETGDLSKPLSDGLIKKDQVFRLGQLINKEIELDLSRTTFFKSVGAALFDLLTAELIYKKALEKGIGTNVEF